MQQEQGSSRARIQPPVLPAPVVETIMATPKVETETEISKNREALRQKLRNKIKGKSHSSAPSMPVSKVRSVLNNQTTSMFPSSIVEGAKDLIGKLNDEDIEKLMSQVMQGNNNKKKLKKNLKKLIDKTSDK